MKQCFWLIKQMVVLTFVGDFDGAAEAWFLLKIHITHKKEKKL